MGNFFLVPVNYFAVLVCGLLATGIGFVWYDSLFGKKRTQQMYLLMFVFSLATAYALFHFIWYAAPGSLTLFISIKTALWGWIGFVVPASFMKHLSFPDKKSMHLLLVEVGYYLVSLIMMGVVFYIFK
jgi:hypothetical protein